MERENDFFGIFSGEFGINNYQLTNKTEYSYEISLVFSPFSSIPKIFSFHSSILQKKKFNRRFLGKLEWTKESGNLSFVKHEAILIKELCSNLKRPGSNTVFSSYKVGIVNYINFVPNLGILKNHTREIAGFSGLFTSYPSTYLENRSIHAMFRDGNDAEKITKYFKRLAHAMVCRTLQKTFFFFSNNQYEGVSFQFRFVVPKNCTWQMWQVIWWINYRWR